jgi:hypothetical protein
VAGNFSWESDAKLILIMTIGAGYQLCKKLLVIVWIDVRLYDLLFLNCEANSDIVLILKAMDGQGVAGFAIFKKAQQG